MSKALEAMFMARLQTFIDENNLKCDKQFGFRHEHSTQQQILRVTEYISREFNKGSNKNKQKIGAVLLDVAKAFDSFWYNGLLIKLIELKAPDSIIHLLNSYFKNRKFVVQVDNTMSEEFVIESGVPQESLIGPKVFNLYIDDIPRHDGVETAVYVDYRIYYTSSKDSNIIVRELNKQLDLAHEWCTKWRIKINADKSEAIIFT